MTLRRKMRTARARTGRRAACVRPASRRRCVSVRRAQLPRDAAACLAGVLADPLLIDRQRRDCRSRSGAGRLALLASLCCGRCGGSGRLAVRPRCRHDGQRKVARAHRQLADQQAELHSAGRQRSDATWGAGCKQLTQHTASLSRGRSTARTSHGCLRCSSASKCGGSCVSSTSTLREPILRHGPLHGDVQEPPGQRQPPLALHAEYEAGADGLGSARKAVAPGQRAPAREQAGVA